jgi:hypothetical protein
MGSSIVSAEAFGNLNRATLFLRENKSANRVVSQ